MPQLRIEISASLRGLAAGAHQDAEHVPEHQCDSGEERQGCGDVLVGVVAVQDSAGGIQNAACGENDHDR
jgi:hypothetical protein